MVTAEKQTAKLRDTPISISVFDARRLDDAQITTFDELSRLTPNLVIDDTLGGACAQESNQVRYAIEKKPMHACRQSFMKGILEWSEANGVVLGKQDIAANINFFMNVPVTPEGGLTFEDGVSEAGKYVELKAETDVLILISNCPQLNNPCNAYNPTPVEILVWPAA